MAQIMKNEVVEILSWLVNGINNNCLDDTCADKDIMTAITEAIRCVKFRNNLVETLKKANYEYKPGYGEVLYITKELVEEILKKA